MVQHLADRLTCYTSIIQQAFPFTAADQCYRHVNHKSRLQKYGNRRLELGVEKQFGQVTKSQDTLGTVPANEMTCDRRRCRLRAAGRAELNG